MECTKLACRRTIRILARRGLVAPGATLVCAGLTGFGVIGKIVRGVGGSIRLCVSTQDGGERDKGNQAKTESRGIHGGGTGTKQRDVRPSRSREEALKGGQVNYIMTLARHQGGEVDVRGGHRAPYQSDKVRADGDMVGHDTARRQRMRAGEDARSRSRPCRCISEDLNLK